MTKIHLAHDFSGQSIGKAEVGSLNNDGIPDYIDLPINFGNLKRTVTITTSDLIEMCKALKVEIKK